MTRKKTNKPWKEIYRRAARVHGTLTKPDNKVVCWQRLRYILWPFIDEGQRQLGLSDYLFNEQVGNGMWPISISGRACKTRLVNGSDGNPKAKFAEDMIVYVKVRGQTIMVC